MAASVTMVAPASVRTADAGGGAPTDGKRFFNLEPFEEHGFGAMLTWMLNRDRGTWEDRTAVASAPPPPRRVGPGELRVTVIGHSTVLVQLDGMNILTDPIYSDRAGPLSWLGSKRMRAPGIRFEDLPVIDAVVVSHNHYDHLDLPTLERLAVLHQPRFFVGLKNAQLLNDAGIANVTELDWWQTAPLGADLRIVGVPAQHWSKRGLGDDFTTLWLGFLIESRAGYVYFAGDTGWGPHFEQIADRFGPARLALLPVGAFRPRFIMERAHMSPPEAADAAAVLQATTSIPIHYGTFALGDDGQDEPITVLCEYLDATALPRPTFVLNDFGVGFDAAGP